MTRHWFAAALVAAVSVWLATPALAGVILITQAKANAGNVTPGDTPGFPVTLSRPGAYRLDTNLTVPAGKNGILVTSHYVDIDMAGFSLFGFNSAGTKKVASNGVVSTFGIGHIHDGIITGFRRDGIQLTGNSNSWVVENMQILSNGFLGIEATASAYSRYLNNSILVNGASGIACGSYCQVEGNNISDNGVTGVVIVSGTVLGNTIFANGGDGIHDATGDADTGAGNNTVVDNNPGGTQQTIGTIALQPNVCSPNPCN